MHFPGRLIPEPLWNRRWKGVPHYMLAAQPLGDFGAEFLVHAEMRGRMHEFVVSTPSPYGCLQLRWPPLLPAS